MYRRSFVKAVAVAAVAPSAVRAADPYPNQPIRLIVPWTAGGSSDVILRLVGQKLTDLLKVQVVVFNKTGAAGTMGAVELQSAKPDGYTLAQIPFGAITAPLMRPTPYDPLRDFTYIANLSSYTNGLVVKADSPFKSFQDYVAFAKSRPGELSYSVAGVGTYGHLATEEIAYRAGIKLLSVPYKGDADSLQALLNGQVMSLTSSTSWAAHVDNGTCRLLALYSPQRSTRWPNAPTIKELGFDTIPDSPFGIAGPKGMDPQIAAKLEDAFRTVMKDAAVAEVLNKFDMPVAFQTGAEFKQGVEATYKNQAETAKRLGIAP
jgi:tripartite-type tricarboxylate transporter receptor subunit TctC